MKVKLLLICLLIFAETQAQQAKSLVSNGKKLPFQEFVVKGEYEARLPFILFLHGAGERGSDNLAQRKVGLPVLMETLKAAGLEHYVLWAPQCPSDQRWTDVDWKATEHTMKKNPTWPMQVLMDGIDSLVLNTTMIDTTRMYIVGLSMGGYGTWEYIARQPYRFASAMPVCGGGDVVQTKNNVSTAVWAFHGQADNVVPYENSVRMVNATKKVNTNVHLISYPDIKHDSWNKAFAEKKIVRDFISTRKK
jgi:predicted peptidase